jgi:Tol biopolymer transport system component
MNRVISIVLVLALGTVAEIAKADFIFGTPTEVPNVNTSSHEQNASISADGLSLFFISKRPGGVGGTEIWVTTRETTDDPWGTPVNLGPTINSSVGDGGVSISSDALSLYFSSTRSSGYGSGDLWLTMRDTIYNEWDTPMNLGPTVNSSADESYPSISADGLALYFTSNRGGGVGAYDLWVTRRETIHDPWGTPENLGPTVNNSAQDVDPGISADGRALFFASNRSAGYGSDDIWMTRRATTDEPWGEPVNLGPIINSSGWEDYPNVSADGSTLFFIPSSSDRWNGGDIWQAPIIPTTDLNADGTVDADDMSIMVHYWGQNEPLCDIGPMPWGDGIVDAQDLIVLSKHLAPGLKAVAHWKLDETARTIAHDSIGSSDATVMGDATWRPEGGLIDGALEFDGVDDHVATDFISDPKVGPVRVVCWVRTDVAGGVIVSQKPGAAFGSTWLATDPADGTLMTEMMFPFPPLYSTALVANGQWHEVTAEWDGTYRRLWADNQEVARDPLSMALPPFSWNGTFIIGAGASLGPDTFFTGLIDDVRIYNRAISP